MAFLGVVPSSKRNTSYSQGGIKKGIGLPKTLGALLGEFRGISKSVLEILVGYVKPSTTLRYES